MLNPIPRTIHIVNIRLIGDIILTTPLIALLREAYPEAAIDLLVNRGTGGFLEKDARVREVLYSEKGHGINLQPVWTSSPAEDEKKPLRETASLCRHQPALLAGELDLNQVTCLISGAPLYVGLDTAVSHLAATTGVPMVTLAGPTIAERWSPWNGRGEMARQCPEPRSPQRTGNIIVIQKKWDCVPCGRSGCDGSGKESPCVQDFQTGQLLESVALLLLGEEGVKYAC